MDEEVCVFGKFFGLVNKTLKTLKNPRKEICVPLFICFGYDYKGKERRFHFDR